MVVELDLPDDRLPEDERPEDETSPGQSTLEDPLVRTISEVVPQVPVLKTRHR
jgi:hypothetical protein